MFPQVAQGRKELDAAVILALESGTVVYTLMGFKPVQSAEIFFTAVNVTAKRPILGMNANVDLETVRIQEGFAAAFFRALECVLP